MTPRRLLRFGLTACLFGLGLLALSPALGAFAATTTKSHSVVHAKAPSPPPPVTPLDTHPSRAELSLGATDFAENCSSCHGAEAQGSELAPDLQGRGAGVVYLWVSSGWMPLANPTSQPITKPALFSPAVTRAIAEYVGSIKPGGLPIYGVNLSQASESEGLEIFAVNCAGCHTITGAGDAISDGEFAPSLHDVDATQVADAIRSGPGSMPVFSPFVISNTQLADLAAYVTRVIKHPPDPGGNGLGGVGPVAEGFIGLFIGVGGCVAGALWIGERAEDESRIGHGEHDHEGSDDEASGSDGVPDEAGGAGSPSSGEHTSPGATGLGESTGVDDA